VVPNSLNPRLS